MILHIRASILSRIRKVSLAYYAMICYWILMQIWMLYTILASTLVFIVTFNIIAIMKKR